MKNKFSSDIECIKYYNDFFNSLGYWHADVILSESSRYYSLSLLNFIYNTWLDYSGLKYKWYKGEDKWYDTKQNMFYAMVSIRSYSDVDKLLVLKVVGIALKNLKCSNTRATSYPEMIKSITDECFNIVSFLNMVGCYGSIRENLLTFARVLIEKSETFRSKINITDN